MTSSDKKQNPDQVHLLNRMFLLIIVASLCFQTFSFAADNEFLPEGTKHHSWSFLRGPGFDGRSLEIHIADGWGEEGPPVLWTRELGQGYSAFVAEDGFIYTQGQTLSGQYLYCLSAETGKTVWKYKIDWPYEGMGVYPGPRSTPTISEVMIYFTAPDGLVGCLNAITGKKIWSKNLLTEYNGTGGDGFGYSCSPLVVDGMVILPVGGPSASMIALDQETGQEIWSEGDSPGSYASAFPIERNSRKLVVGYLQNSLVIHDRMSGELLHEVKLSQGYDEHSCWPIYQEPYLWTSAPFRSGSKLYKLPEDFSSDEELEIVWNSKTMSNDVLSSVLVDDHIYGFDIFDVQSKTQRPSRGMFRCIDFMTGEEKWSQGTGRPRRGGDKDDPDEIGQAGMIAVDGKIILLNERGELILLKATPEKMEVLARTSVLGGELTWTPPCLHRGRLYIRNHSRAVCVYVGEPELFKSQQPTLTVADIPQSKYRDLAAILIPVEPEFMFDVPSPQWMWNWYLTSLAMLCFSGLFGYLAGFLFSLSRRATSRTILYRLMAFSLGAVGTTYLSELTQEFHFTWPLCLYIAFEPVVLAVRKRTRGKSASIKLWKERTALLFCAITCVIYYQLCRRLSLVFEWAFLMGFFGSIPFLLIQNKVKNSRMGILLLRPLLIVLAFSGFYLCGLLPLLVGY
ncbi:MAG: PQQ-binding-like beta-propeller repeat protein [Planctomicrobium sp.]|jgi:outer membrane protein assembly factor BamB|nr:PQQ-binding-like beta-propeller repeat protein [Planctomicrobium sp.]